MTPSNDDIDFCKDKHNATKLRLAAVVGCGCYKNNYHNVFQAGLILGHLHMKELYASRTTTANASVNMMTSNLKCGDVYDVIEA